MLNKETKEKLIQMSKNDIAVYERLIKEEKEQIKKYKKMVVK